MRALVIPVNGEMSVKEVDGTIEGVQEWLLDGGWVEVVSGMIKGGRIWNIACDEDGKLKRLPMNETATRVAAALGWTGIAYDMLVGPVAIFGSGGPESAFGNVPDRVVEVARTIGVVN